MRATAWCIWPIMTSWSIPQQATVVDVPFIQMPRTPGFELTVKHMRANRKARFCTPRDTRAQSCLSASCLAVRFPTFVSALAVLSFAGRVDSS
ncbi:hypothetical protein PENSPDRAFT_402168 [Peniophora sp. CONT]|nr:hypothetical protein PENSPDRAFT_402168 [Peniophora sp. CONT]